jgi:ketosteroid isomerase-like protein
MKGVVVEASAGRASSWRIDIKQEREALLAADGAQADATASQGFASGFAAYLAEDAVYLPAGTGAVRGAPAIEAHLSAQFDAATVLSREPLRADVSAAGDVGYTFGWTETAIPSSGGPPSIAYGKYVAWWTKDVAGNWRLASYLPNASAAPAHDVPSWFHALVDNGVRAARPVDVAAETALLIETDQAFSDRSVTSGTRDAFTYYAARDAAVLLDGDGVVFGPEEIGEAYTFPEGVVLRWTPLEGLAAATGDLGHTFGIYELDVPTPGGIVTVHGKYLSLWEKQPSGAWRYVADGGNSNPPPGP